MWSKEKGVGFTIVAMAGRGLASLHASSAIPGLLTPGRQRRNVRRQRRLLQGAVVVAALWMCCQLLVPSKMGKAQRASEGTAAADVGAANGAVWPTDGGAANGAVWPTDGGAEELEARQRFLRQQQAVRRQLAEQRAAMASRPHSGLLPDPPPKVALMFLVRGYMPLEPVWQTFFEAAAEIEPVALPAPYEKLAGTQQRRRHLATAAQPEVTLADAAALFSEGAADAAQGPGGQYSAAGQHQQLVQEKLDEERVLAEAAAQGVDPRAGAGEDEEQGRKRREAKSGAAAGGTEGVHHDWLQMQDKPLTQQQQEHVEANKQLEEALSKGQEEQAQHAQQQVLRSRTMEASLSMMSPLDPDGVIARQDLFSVYMHTMPGYYYGNTSIFAGYQIDRRVFVSWGQYTVAEAERRLIIAALTDRRNQRFVLVSETCTPLYPPHVLYLQLLGDTKSRVNACANQDGSAVERWNSALYLPGLLTPDKWRKSTQWKSLTREHAMVVASDRQLAPRFERECYSFFPPIMVRPPYVIAQNRVWVQRSCISDEHYIPTLLAVHKKDHETTCTDSLTVADWVVGLWSPKVHHQDEVNPVLLRRMRKQRATEIDCSAADAIASAGTMFRRRGASTTLAGTPLPGIHSAADGGSNSAVSMRRQSLEQSRQGYKPLNDGCFLLARKFAPDSVQSLLQLAEDCQEGTAISPSCLHANSQV